VLDHERDRTVFLRTKEQIDSSWQVLLFLHLFGLQHAQSYSHLMKASVWPESKQNSEASVSQLVQSQQSFERKDEEDSEHDSYISERAKQEILSDRHEDLHCSSQASGSLVNEACEVVPRGVNSRTTLNKSPFSQTQPLLNKEDSLGGSHDDEVLRLASSTFKAGRIVGELEN